MLRWIGLCVFRIWCIVCVVEILVFVFRWLCVLLCCGWCVWCGRVWYWCGLLDFVGVCLVVVWLC